MTLQVILSTYNCFTWLPRCLGSIRDQKGVDFEVTVLDNASTQAGQWEWTEHFCRKLGWRAVRSAENLGPLGGLMEATRIASPAEDDVIIHIDGDDWLAHDGVFAYIQSIYDRGDVDLTFGHYHEVPADKPGPAMPYSREEIEQRQFRYRSFRTTHLRTFKSFLWRALDDRDLRGVDGKYLRYAPDLAFLFPMLEMVGERFYVVRDVLYIYNRGNPTAETADWGYACAFVEASVRLRPRYEVLDRCRKSN